MVNTNISDKLGGNIHIKKIISNKKNTSRSDSYNKYLNENRIQLDVNLLEISDKL